MNSKDQKVKKIRKLQKDNFWIKPEFNDQPDQTTTTVERKSSFRATSSKSSSNGFSVTTKKTVQSFQNSSSPTEYEVKEFVEIQDVGSPRQKFFRKQSFNSNNMEGINAAELAPIIPEEFSTAIEQRKTAFTTQFSVEEQQNGFSEAEKMLELSFNNVNELLANFGIASDAPNTNITEIVEERNSSNDNNGVEISAENEQITPTHTASIPTEENEVAISKPTENEQITLNRTASKPLEYEQITLNRTASMPTEENNGAISKVIPPKKLSFDKLAIFEQKSQKPASPPKGQRNSNTKLNGIEKSMNNDVQKPENIVVPLSPKVGIVPENIYNAKRVEEELPQFAAAGSSWSPFELECLASHNEYRARHGCSALKLNRELCEFATEWAKYLATTQQMMHRQQNPYGENIYYANNIEPSAAEAVKSWYDEIEMYNFATHHFAGNTGHFTQVVWRGTKELGVGRAKVGPITLIVCNYNPAGNMMGNFKQQVPAPLHLT